MLIYSVLRKVRNCATKQKMWQITSILFRVLTENFYIVPFPCKFRFSFGGKFKFTKETLNFKKTRPLMSSQISLTTFVQSFRWDFLTLYSDSNIKTGRFYTFKIVMLGNLRRQKLQFDQFWDPKMPVLVFYCRMLTSLQIQGLATFGLLYNDR